MSGCCGESISFVKQRTVLIQSTKSFSTSTRAYKKPIARNQNLIEYKALAKRAGINKNYDVKVGLIGTHSPIGQAIQSIGSAAIPGNLSPVRSPIRSGIFGALTPGKPRIPGGTGGSNRAYRCPEGYQYGGRFTDSRLSTCGAKLFDIPGPLGAAIGAIRRIARGARAIAAASTPITGEPVGDSLVQSRKPQIPRVSNANPKAASVNARDIVRQMGQLSTPVTRMVRRDGFILEPVVPAQVLRAIPDNRDMEGANYIMLATRLPDLGGQELGLLSNTGVTKLTYVLPGGSSITLEKRRPLTVGERRKLGRTVNSAAKISIENDPTARLREVVNQTGDGIGYTESFVNIKNPNETVVKNGKSIPKWADEIYGKGRKARPVAESARETDSDAEIGKLITSIDEAIDHIAKGGSLSKVDPSILQQAITRANVFKRQKLDSSREIITAPDGRKYVQYRSSSNFEHIAQKFSADIQQHLGLESPDVFFVGTGDRRQYLTEEAGSILRGFNVDRRKTMKDYSPEDVAKMLISDWLTDSRGRPPGSVISVSNGEETRPVISDNRKSGLVDLDKISIVERQKATFADFLNADENLDYRRYFQELKEQQRFAFRKEIEALLLRARRFNFTKFKDRLYSDGKLSSAEKAHLNIIGKILETRIKIYSNSKDTLMDILGAKK
jgi:hypothetical protein